MFPTRLKTTATKPKDVVCGEKKSPRATETRGTEKLLLNNRLVRLEKSGKTEVLTGAGGLEVETSSFPRTGCPKRALLASEGAGLPLYGGLGARGERQRVGLTTYDERYPFSRDMFRTLR